MSEPQRIFPVVMFVFLVIACGFTAGCISSVESSASHQQSAKPTGNSTFSLVDRVEVIHFHGDQQCVTCKEVGDLAEETVKEYFPMELSSGKLSFMHINFDDPVNKNYVTEYGLTGSSLWITTYDANGIHRTQDLDVWSLTEDKEKYKAYLASVINRRLNGDLS